ncbi:unnamed protein product, partial [Prorocentrum cordatum]
FLLHNIARSTPARYEEEHGEQQEEGETEEAEEEEEEEEEEESRAAASLAPPPIGSAELGSQAGSSRAGGIETSPRGRAAGLGPSGAQGCIIHVRNRPPTNAEPAGRPGAHRPATPTGLRGLRSGRWPEEPQVRSEAPVFPKVTLRSPVGNLGEARGKLLDNQGAPSPSPTKRVPPSAPRRYRARAAEHESALSATIVPS